MQPIFAAARKVPPERSRIVYAEGEDERVLRAVQIAVDEKLAVPILVGRPAVIERAIKRHGLRIRAGEHFTWSTRTRRALSRILAGVHQAHRAPAA
jgi:malate dehydrogenase (oxaloacetate-decarboxylating)(NADP+)